MNWRDYEKEVYDYFSTYYPGSSIQFDQKIIGKFSKIQRQIDILIETEIEKQKQTIIIDCKFFSRKIDVKLIESFSSMVEDVEAGQGILITNIGYSKAAINRAHYGNENIELDIINFETIQKFQGYVAIPYTNHFTVSLFSPFGWVLDLDNPINDFAVLHQRGVTLPEAQEKGEWAYLNFWKKKEENFSIDNLIEIQNEYIQEGTKAKFKILKGPNRKDKAESKIRIADVESYSTLEVTGFIDFEEYIFFIVLFTTIPSLNKNLRKLFYMLDMAIPMRIAFDNSNVINQLLRDAEETSDLEEKANMYHQVANWYKEMYDIENAMLYYRKSIKTFPNHYSSIRQLIFELVVQQEYKQAEMFSKMFFISAPTNPTVLQDLIDIYMENERPDLLEIFLDKLLVQTADKEALGNISFHQGQLALFLKKNEDALRYFQITKNHFNTVLPKNHEVFKTLKEYMRLLSQRM